MPSCSSRSRRRRGAGRLSRAASNDSTGGITAWLAEDQASPLLSLRFAFIGGSTAEPLRQGGVSRVLARLLLEGSDEPDFKMRVQRAGLRIGFQSGRDALFGSAD